MIDNLSVSSFFAFEPLGQLPAVPFGRTLGSVCLCPKRTPNLLPMFTVGIKLFSRMASAIRGYNYIRDTKIATYILLHLRSILLGNLHGLIQEKLSLPVHQLSFPFAKGKIMRMMANKLNLLPAAKTPQRNYIISFIAHDTVIVGNGTKESESAFVFFVQLVGIYNLVEIGRASCRERV